MAEAIWEVENTLSARVSDRRGTRCGARGGEDGKGAHDRSLAGSSKDRDKRRKAMVSFAIEGPCGKPAG